MASRSRGLLGRTEDALTDWAAPREGPEGARWEARARVAMFKGLLVGYGAIAALVWALLTQAAVAWVATGAAFIVFLWFYGVAVVDILHAKQAKRRFLENGGQVMEYGLFGRPKGPAPRRVAVNMDVETWLGPRAAHVDPTPPVPTDVPGPPHAE